MANVTDSRTNGITSGTNGTESEVALLPCPFCGGEGIDEYEGEYGNGVYCMSCGAMMGEQIHREFHVHERVAYKQAVEAWNTRAAVIDHDFAMAVHDGNLWGKCSECERVKDAEMEAAVQCGEAAYANDAVRQRDALIRDMWPLVLADGASEAFAERMRELGIEVDE